MQNALNKTWEWCRSHDLSINPRKTVIVPFTKRRNLDLRTPTLGGSTIDFASEAKYLGVVLDQKLTWNSHIKRILEKATAAMWACQRVVGRTWGLRPKMAYWVYQTVVRPMVTYASLVWWRKVDQKTTQAKLQKLQRLACLGITGAMSTCPTAAMEALLDLLPLHLQVKKEAMICALSLQRNAQLKPADMVGRLEIIRHLQDDWLAITIPDNMPKRLTLERPFEVVITNRQTWESGGPDFERGSLIWYTDGSKMDKGAGAGVYGPNYRLSKSMGSYASIFQAEIHAVELCALENLKRHSKGQKIYILSDSQAALKALISFTCESKMVWQCKETLRQLARNNKVILMWVPGHEGIAGNETADSLAKEGAESPFVGPEPFCGVPSGHTRMKIRLWEDKNKSLY